MLKMIKKFYHFKFIGVFFCFLVFVFWFLFFAPAKAQEIRDNLVLTWSANTYVPFDYPGKALPVYGSLATVAVIPVSKPTLNLETLNYNWFLDDEPQIAASGENKQDFTFKVTTFGSNEHSIKVQIKNKEETLSLELSTTIKIVSPEIVLYSFDQETEKAESIQGEQTILFAGQEKTFIGSPYFFNIKNINELGYQWSFENQIITKTEKPGLFTLKIGQGELERAFSRELSIFVENQKNRVQRASNKIEIVVK